MNIASDDMGPWLSQEDLDLVRRKVPMLYVDIVPVRQDPQGQLDTIGLLLRVRNDDTVVREIVTGRVLYQETITQAIARHIEKDLGPMALPQLPLSPLPFAVGQYFPTPGNHFYDERQHAVSLAFIVPVAGDCAARNDTLELSWLTPGEAQTPDILGDMPDGHRTILTQALAYMGHGA